MPDANAGPDLSAIMAGLDNAVAGKDSPPIRTIEPLPTEVVEFVKDEPVIADIVKPISEPETKVEPEVKKTEYATYQEYVDAGNDAAFYQGPKAYENNQKLLAEKRDFRDRLKSNEDQMGEFVSRQNTLLEDTRKGYELKLAEAKENEDFAAFTEATDGLGKLPQPQQVQRSAPTEMDVIADKRRANPKLDHASPSFDSRYSTMFENELNKSCLAAEQRVGRRLNDDEVQQHLNTVEASLNQYLNVDVATPIAPSAPAPQRVGSGGRPTNTKPKASAMNDQDKFLYEKWSKSSDPKFQEYAKKLKSNFEART